MRPTALLTLALLVVPAIALLPAAEARTVYCTDLRSPTCPGFVCVDTSLDGSIQPEECVDVYCGISGCCPITTGCCGSVCPPPPEVESSCRETNVGGDPAGASVGWGVEPRCIGLSYTTCRFTYDPSEPNTPVWVCTEKRIL